MNKFSLIGIALFLVTQTVNAQIFAPRVKVFQIPNDNVGIGTETPQYKLDVAGTINATEYLINGSPFSGGSWSTSGSNLNYSQGKVSIGLNSFYESQLNIEGEEAIAIRYNTASTFGRISSVTNDWIAIMQNLSYHTDTQDFHLDNTSLTGWAIKLDSRSANYANCLDFWAFPAGPNPRPYGTSNRVLTLKPSGNVGIGNANPSYKLDVAGEVHATTFSATTPPWADFVFEPHYELMPLEDVSSFISENKHLPNFPSEDELQASGLNLPAMDAKLTQKIEELTLYTIQIHDRLKLLEEENQLLRERIESLEKD